LSAAPDVTQEYRLVTGREDGCDFVHEERFLTDDECDLLVAAFERCSHLTFRTPTGDRFFDDRFLWINSLPSTENRAKRLMQATRYRIIGILRAFYAEPAPLYADTIQLVKWLEGQGMPAHADNAHPDGSRHNTPWRKYASVVYLNDDYEGGELFIEPLRIRIETRKGLLLGFRGDFSHAHGVTTVTHGVRYTMPAWYTDEVEHRDRYDRETFAD